MIGNGVKVANRQLSCSFYAEIHKRYKRVKVFTSHQSKFEPAHEIMALFVLRKLILQTRMHGHPLGLDV